MNVNQLLKNAAAGDLTGLVTCALTEPSTHRLAVAAIGAARLFACSFLANEVLVKTCQEAGALKQLAKHGEKIADPCPEFDLAGLSNVLQKAAERSRGLVSAFWSFAKEREFDAAAAVNAGTSNLMTLVLAQEERFKGVTADPAVHDEVLAELRRQTPVVSVTAPIIPPFEQIEAKFGPEKAALVRDALDVFDRATANLARVCSMVKE